MAGALLAAAVPLLLSLVWAFAAVPSQIYEAKATVEFHPGQPVNADEGLRAFWALVPHGADIGILVVPGRPHVYEVSARRPEAGQATGQVESTVAAMDGAARSGTSTFRVIEPAGALSAPTHPRRHFLLKDCLIPLLLPLWVGGALWAYRRRLQSLRAHATAPL